MNTNGKLRVAILGCGFWARYQLPAWLELEGVEVIALYNRTIYKAEELARQYNIPNCYDDAEDLFKNEHVDFVDIISDVDTHEYFTLKAAKYGIPVICQKPMAPSLLSAGKMLDACNESNTPFFIHEGFRWQAPIRRLKEIIDSGVIGQPFKARVSFCSAFPVFDNQPFLANLDKFIITDIGSHILDVCRFLFGEAETLYCLTQTVNKKIKGEDVANIFIKMKSGLHCIAELSYASILEKEIFPQTLILVEGSEGSVQLTHDFLLKITTKQGTECSVIKPIFYQWADPAYLVVHSSIVDCNRNILEALQGSGTAETTGQDNFETVKLVWAAYTSAEENKVINMSEFGLKNSL
ncbi:MAG TPA: Gfo/Idh/MocA family oxidoreductase [Chitinophagaceae bacterium]|nr:Gfo/Idh/MocA family oxidoreductase [Chitinophagaceae bacterium]